MRLAKTLVMLGFAAMAACGTPPAQVWFTPNVASEDLLDLFRHPEQWRAARGAIDVFEFYALPLVASSPAECPDCGPNRLDALRQVDAFRQLSAWGVDVAIEVSAVKDWDCRGEKTAELARQAIANVEANGGRVKYLSMDNPLFAVIGCDQGIDDTAAAAARFVRGVHAAYPRVLIGESEPYPRFAVAVITAWEAALLAEGVTPAFLHLDVDRAYAERIQADVSGDLRLIRSFSHVRRVPFGVIFWSDRTASSAAYYEDALGWVRRVADIMGPPDHSVFQSWAVSPDGSLTVPRNLPEADPEVFSHTRLIADGLAVLRASPPPPQPRPR